MRFSVGDALADSGDLTLRRLRRAYDWRKAHGGTIERALLETRAVSEQVLTAALSKASGYPGATREQVLAAKPSVVARLEADGRRRLRAIPFEKVGASLKVAVADADNPVLETGLVASTGSDVELYVITDPVLEDCLNYWEQPGAESAVFLLTGEEEPAAVPVVPDALDPFDRLGRALLVDALHRDAVEMELGTDAYGGFARMFYPPHPPRTMRLSRALVAPLIDWYRWRGRSGDPSKNLAFEIEVVAKEGLKEQLAIEHDGLREQGDAPGEAVVFGQKASQRRRVELVPTVGGMRVLFDQPAETFELDAGEKCNHEASQGCVFCPNCGEPV